MVNGFPVYLYVVSACTEAGPATERAATAVRASSILGVVFIPDLAASNVPLSGKELRHATAST